MTEGAARRVPYIASIEQEGMPPERPQRIVDARYGMVSDGILWRFLHLEEKCL